MNKLMTLTVNGVDAEVFGTDRKNFTDPVTVKTAKVTRTFDNILQFWGFVQPMRVTNIVQNKQV